MISPKITLKAPLKSRTLNAGIIVDFLSDGTVIANKNDLTLNFTSVWNLSMPEEYYIPVEKIDEFFVEYFQDPIQSMRKIHEIRCDRVIERTFKLFEERDIVPVIGLIDGLSSNAPLVFVADNYWHLKMHGLYEKAMVQAFSCGRHTHYKWKTSMLRLLISNCNQNKSINCGDPLPKGKTFTLYRGVAGPPSARRVKGFSWTLDPIVAARFADRGALRGGWHDPRPAIYQTVVPRESIYWYFNERNEQEVVLLDPGKVKTYIKDRETIKAMVKEYEASKN